MSFAQFTSAHLCRNPPPLFPPPTILSLAPHTSTFQVLFPLLADLSPEASGAGAGGAGGVPHGDVLLDLDEQRVALITTITRTFKKHIGTMAALPDFHPLWLKLVGG